MGVGSLIWHFMGCLNYIMQLNPESVATFPESHRAIIEGRPAWATAGFALAVFGGLLGSALMLMRKSAAIGLFIVALVGVLVQLVHSAGVAGSTSFTTFEMVLMFVMPLAVAMLLVLYSRRARERGWIK